MNSYQLTAKLKKVRADTYLTAADQALFHELVLLCNETQWKEVFFVRSSVLCSNLNMSDNTLRKSRKTLSDAHLLYFATSKDKRFGCYYSFVKQLDNDAALPAASPAMASAASPSASLSKSEYDKKTSPATSSSNFTDDAPITPNNILKTINRESHAPTRDAPPPPREGGPGEKEKVEKSLETPWEEPLEKPLKDPSETPWEEPLKKHLKDPSERPWEEHLKKSLKDPSETPWEEPLEKPLKDPSETPWEEPLKKHLKDPSERPWEEHLKKSLKDPSETPWEEPLEKPLKNPSKKPLEKPLEYPFASTRFRSTWEVLRQTPKWKGKLNYALQLSLNKLGKFEEDFAIEQMERAIESNWTGVVFPGTEVKYQEWLNLKYGKSTHSPLSSPHQSATERKASVERLTDLAGNVLRAIAAEKLE